MIGSKLDLRIENLRLREDGNTAPEVPQLPPFNGIHHHVLLCQPRRAFFRVMEVIDENRVLVEDKPGRECAGMLIGCDASRDIMEHEENKTHMLCEVVAVSQSCVRGTEAWNVLWIGTSLTLKSTQRQHYTSQFNLSIQDDFVGS